MNCSYYIDSATIIAVDDQHGTTPFQASMRISNGIITEIGEGLEPIRHNEIYISGYNRLVIPGFINAHTHNWENFWRGTQDNLPLELWMLMCYPAIGSKPLSSELVYLRTLLLAAESLKSGVTTVVDDAYEIPTQTFAHISAEFDAYRKAGIRANLSGQISDRPFLDTMPYAREYLSQQVQSLADEIAITSAQEYISFAEQAIQSFDKTGDGGRLRFMVAPSAPQRCTPELLQGCHELAVRYDCEFHTHVLETRTQRIHSDIFTYDNFRGSFIQWFEELGVLSPHLTLAHGVWLSEEELATLSHYGCSLSHNPLSNLKLGSGLLPYSEVKKSGINLALGTDGVCSSDTQRLAEVMKSTALLHKITSENPDDWPTVDEVIRAATINGARSARLGDRVGSVEVGKEADLVFYDLDTLAFCPRNDVDKQLVYSENGSSIVMVMVAGDIVCQDGELSYIDEQELRSQIEEYTPWIHEWQTQVMKENEVFLEGFWKQYQKAVSTFHHSPQYSYSSWVKRAQSVQPRR